MRRLVTFLAAFVAATAIVSVAAAATDPARPAAGAYTLGAKSGFTVNKKRTAVTKFRIALTVDADGTDATSDCTSSTLPTGKVVASVSTPLKIIAAHRGGYTAYIVGRSTPKTSNGITPIPETFHFAGGVTAKGTMYLAFSSDRPKTGDGEVVIDGCTLVAYFHKKA